MKRSLRFQRMPVPALLPPGRVAVATAFHQPGRGLVTCPAAPLLGGGLRRSGVAVEYVDWTNWTDWTASTSSGQDTAATEPAIAPTVSYVERDGGARGLAAAVPAGDEDLVRLVTGVLGEWARLLRTRRVVWAGTAPWCSGLAAAMRTIDRLLPDGPVHVLGEPPPPPAARRLTRRGAVFVDRVDDIPPGARVIVGAAGVGLSARAELSARGMTVTDATCPLVTAAAHQVRTFAEQGETVVLVADPSQAAVPGLRGQAPERVTVTGSRYGVAAVEVADPARVAVVMAPGTPLTRAVPVAEAVRARFGHVLPQHSASLCYEPSDRVAALRRLATETDVVLVAGPADRDSHELVAEITAAGTRCHPVACAEHIEPDWLRGTASIGITASLAAANGLVERITGALAGLGPATVVALAAGTVPIPVPIAGPVAGPVTRTPAVGLTPA